MPILILELWSYRAKGESRAMSEGSRVFPSKSVYHTRSCCHLLFVDSDQSKRPLQRYTLGEPGVRVVPTIGRGTKGVKVGK